MIERPVTVVDGNSPMCEEQARLAAELLAAGKGIAVLIRQPSDNEQSFAISALVSSMQTLVSQSVKAGMDDEDIFKAMAATLGWAAKRQNLGPIRDWVGQLSMAALKSAQMCLDAAGFGFETRGRA